MSACLCFLFASNPNIYSNITYIYLSVPYLPRRSQEEELRRRGGRGMGRSAGFYGALAEVEQDEDDDARAARRGVFSRRLDEEEQDLDDQYDEDMDDEPAESTTDEVDEQRLRLAQFLRRR